MKHDKFNDVLNNSKELTIGQIFKLLLKIKISALMTFAGVFLTITGSAYVAGKSSIKKETAVMLQSPFSMRLDLENNSQDLNNLTLVEDPSLVPPSSDTMLLSLRQVRSSFDIVPIGKVLAKVENTKSLPVWKWLFSKVGSRKAYASDFDWNGHETDMEFKEKFVQSEVVHRYYADGCILQYAVNKNRKSMPDSFVWYKRTH